MLQLSHVWLRMLSEKLPVKHRPYWSTSITVEMRTIRISIKKNRSIGCRNKLMRSVDQKKGNIRSEEKNMELTKTHKI